jgi:hypothetical protein
LGRHGSHAHSIARFRWRPAVKIGGGKAAGQQGSGSASQRGRRSAGQRVSKSVRHKGPLRQGQDMRHAGASREGGELGSARVYIL